MHEDETIENANTMEGNSYFLFCLNAINFTKNTDKSKNILELNSNEKVLIETVKTDIVILNEESLFENIKNGKIIEDKMIRKSTDIMCFMIKHVPAIPKVKEYEMDKFCQAYEDKNAKVMNDIAFNQLPKVLDFANELNTDSEEYKKGMKNIQSEINKQKTEKIGNNGMIIS